MAVVYQKNKGSGIVCAYESQAFWVKEKQQSRAKRKCIGKVDPETGQIIPNRKKKQERTPYQSGPSQLKVDRVSFPEG